MTVIVGIYCQDGVVIGSDSSATFVAGQTPTIEQQVEKIEIIDKKIIISGSGSVGHGQRFSEIVNKLWANNEFKGSALQTTKLISRCTIEDSSFTYSKQGCFTSLIAFPLNSELFLCEFYQMDLQPEIKNTNKLWYVSIGSGQSIADPFLGFLREIFWKEGRPNLNEAILAATWTLDFVISVNAGGVNGPVQMAILEKNNGEVTARMIDQTELDEHRQGIAEAKQSLRLYKERFHEIGEGIPSIPKP
jgi:20S proteasome alpha/beta subunit